LVSLPAIAAQRKPLQHSAKNALPMHSKANRVPSQAPQKTRLFFHPCELGFSRKTRVSSFVSMRDPWFMDIMSTKTLGFPVDDHHALHTICHCCGDGLVELKLKLS
jgi:hypothetical protein